MLSISHVLAKGSRRVLLLALVALLPAGCLPPPPKYSDPLSELQLKPGTSGPLNAAAQAGPTIALVFGSNIERVLTHKEQRNEVLKAFPGTSEVIADQDPQPLITGAVTTLRLRYPRLEPVDDLNAAASRKFATTIVLDFQVVIGNMSFQETTATITAIMLDGTETPVSRIETSAKRTVPWPNTGARFREASDSALGEFSRKVNQLWN
jgi:hypothetical protein